MRITLLLFIACMLTAICNAQLQITNETSPLALAQKLVGNGITISNVTFTGNSLMAGHFKNLNGLTNIDIDSGIVLTTGTAKTNSANFATGVDGNGTTVSSSILASTGWNLPGDATLANAIDANVSNMNDACVLEFDFIPLGDTVKFNYIFSSEEYEPAFACSEYIDAFGFFISGPGIVGQKNIALVPGTALPVSILNINNVIDFSSPLCPLNPAYYIDNSINKYFTHEGHTKKLTAVSQVQPCNVYHLKLVISDNSDAVWDSGVFLQAKSLSSNIVQLTNNTQVDNSNNSYVVEGCNSGSFTIKRVPASPIPLIVQLTYAGTAINGVDVVTLPPTVTIPANDSVVVLIVKPLADGIPEGLEYLKIFAGSGCGSGVPNDSTIIQIRDIDSSSAHIAVCPNTLPYSWHGNSYAAYGTYYDTLVNSLGCDSIAILYLATSSGSTSITNIAVCSNDLPYTWNGNNYSAAGSYPVTITNTGICDSVATLNLTIKNTSTSLTNKTVCNNTLPYSWNGNNYSAAGIYQVTLTSANGCDSIAKLNLTINNTSTSSNNITICNTELPYIWNGNNYPAAGTYSVTLTSAGGCDSIATLNLGVKNTSTSNNAATVCNTELPYLWNGNSYPSGGTYSVTLTAANGCDSIATLALQVISSTASTTIRTVCDAQLPYSWNGNSYPAGGTYSVTLTSVNGCDSVATLQLLINNSIGSSENAAVCSTALPYTWNGNNYSASGTYSVTLTSNSGCDSVVTLTLVVNNTATSLKVDTICNNNLPYLWNGNSYPGAGIYYVTLSSSAGCDSIATLKLIVKNTTSGFFTATICDTELPYNWNGNNYSSAGTYLLTLTGSNGCDSIATLNLAVKTSAASSNNVSACSTQLPYAWNGNTYPTAGTYPVTLTAANGCDSIATLHLFIVNTATSFNIITICSTQLPFSWNGNSYSSAGIYSVTLTAVSGCDSIATLKLLVNNTSTSLTELTICNLLLPFSWNGNTYLSAGTYAVTLTSATNCDSIATLDLSVVTFTSSTTNTTVCSDQIPYLWNGQTLSASGQYTAQLTGTGGCDSIATLNFTIHQTQTTPVVATTCNNQLPYSWNGQSYNTGGLHTVILSTTLGCDSIVTLNLTVHTVSTSNSLATICANALPFSWNGQNYSTAGLHNLTLVNANGCDSVATLNLTVNPVKLSTTNVSRCSAQLPYNWNGQTYNSSGLHTITLTSAAGCDSLATLNLIVSPTPPAPGISPLIYCQQDIALPLTATTASANQLVWHTLPTGGSGSSVPPIPPTNNAGALLYYVSQVAGPCEGPRVPLAVTVNSKPNLGADKSVQICFGQFTNLEALYNNAGFTTSWTKDHLPVNTPVKVNTAGLYTLMVQNSFGCMDTAVVNLGVQPPVIADAGPDDNAEYNAPYQLTGTGGIEYQWSSGDLLNNAFISNPIAILKNDATLVLMVKDEIGCAAFDTVKLRVLKGPSLYVPTAFSPNNDGLNDVFRATSVGISSLDFFRVFNRYGAVIFETTDVSKGWDGTYKGVKQGSGNYIWTIKGLDRKNKTIMKSGNVMLIR